ncbi:MAG: DUF4493 domain-containing protein [Tannerellaceae bacterium]|nr:DUF4493 domain-containing protein [Tannerellaceae bacterium]
MKNKYLHIGFWIGVSMLLFSCEMRDELRNTDEPDEVKGSLLLGLEVDVKSESGSVSLDVKDFCIQITDKDGTVVKEIPVYGELSADEQLIELPVGEYIVKASSYSGEIEEAVFDKPYYTGEQKVTIEENKQETISIVCTLQSVKVEISYDKEFLENVEPGFTVLLTNGKGVLVLENGSTQSAYFKESNAIQITVRATTKEGEFVSSTSSFRNNISNTASAGDVFQVLIKLEEKTGPVDPVDPEPGPDPDPEPGIGNFEIVIEVIWNGQEIEIEIPRPGEEGGGEDPDPSLGDPVIDGAGTFIYDEAGNPKEPWMSEVRVTMSIPNGIKHLYLNIESTSQDFVDLIPQLLSCDLANPTPKAEETLIELGLLQEGMDITNETQFVFDVTVFVGLLPGFHPNTHDFHLEIVDQLDKTAKDTLSIHVVSGF